MPNVGDREAQNLVAYSKMKKYVKPAVTEVKTEVEEFLLIGSVKYTSEEADTNFDVLANEREDNSEWGDIW